jgi:hypothetical protein
MYVLYYVVATEYTARVVLSKGMVLMVYMNIMLLLGISWTRAFRRSVPRSAVSVSGALGG